MRRLPTTARLQFVRYCERHLTIARLPASQAQKREVRAAREHAWLYSDGEQFESSHGRQPGTMKALALEREKRAKKS